MHKHMKIKKQLSDTFRFPDDVLMDTPVVKIIADNEVIIENHKGISEYTNLFLKIYTSIGVICISGESLFIKEIDKDVILVSGKIDSLDYIKWGDSLENNDMLLFMMSMIAAVTVLMLGAAELRFLWKRKILWMIF